jgi:GT2 family glycosyltransferase
MPFDHFTSPGLIFRRGRAAPPPTHWQKPKLFYEAVYVKRAKATYPELQVMQLLARRASQSWPNSARLPGRSPTASASGPMNLTLAVDALFAILILEGLISLILGFRHLAAVRRLMSSPQSDFAPKVSLIAPHKGLDCGIQENLRALFDQDYPDYEIIFAVASADDPARQAIERAISEEGFRPARLVIAGASHGRSEKVNNLLAALDCASPDSEAFVFVDSDVRVWSGWLRALVAPLADPGIGAATGYRWYLPDRGGFFSAMLSAWNGSVATTLGDDRRNFAWGGSTAILRRTFDRARIRDRWRGAASDDYTLTEAIRSAGLRIRFVPSCLLVSRQDMSLADLLEFTTRQVIITRVYHPKLWWLGMISHSLFSAVFFGGLASLAWLSGRAPLLLAAIYLLGSAKGALRLDAARRMIPQARDEIGRTWWAFCLLWPIVSLIFFYNFLRSIATRRILWRGVIYELRSPTETVVLGPGR